MDRELRQFSTPPSQPTADGGPHSESDWPLLTCDPPFPVSPDDLLELHQKFAPYVRSDVYGTMGRGDLPWEEKFLLAAAFATLVPFRVTVGSAIVILYYLICRLCTGLTDSDGDDEQQGYVDMVGWRRFLIVYSGRFLARAMLFMLGFYWIDEFYLTSSGEDEDIDENERRERFEDFERPGVIVSNHISYLDILYHISSFFPSFVAKKSVAKLPIVGFISKCIGCVYVQRESKSTDSKGVSGIVKERVLAARQNKLAPLMLLFPEGTTTNGDFLLPFKTGAFLSKTPVLPVILRYPYERFSPAWDTISAVRHVILLLCQFVNYMEVTYLPIYYPSKQEKEDLKLYASNVRKLMARKGNLILSDMGLPEKRIYHAALNDFFHLHDSGSWSIRGA
ncbi:lysophospholipid acyltransferase LPEAT1-like isoform X2 [Magnolia sinica]|uniref:lysophospholipid acyltransferase LPEAT1-like isoform X2 n=1 Tax=Magnolia sinica TaxID=86752 RepID=UPI002659ABCB|nr:lysophospholipid acyltransferase LPEAT1-like isoform X2 [Magnolia sinica]